MRPVFGHELWQRPTSEVTSFWDSTADWRIRYFEDLKATQAERLPDALRAEREFVLLEERITMSEVADAHIVVELGCGVGRSLRRPARTYVGSRFNAIDFAMGQLRCLNQIKVSEQLHNVFAVAANVASLPLLAESADAILILNQTFGTFLGDVRTAVLREIGRTLRPDGFVLIGGFDAVDHAQGCYSEWNVPLLHSDKKAGFFQLAHYNSFWQKEEWLVSELDENGFTLVRRERCNLGYVLIFRRQ
jgi:ubiquinone/menaquinone biosynthesis C-methylase UbiE